MLISKSCQYAIRAMVFITKETGNNTRKVGLKEIAKGINTPVHFTGKVLQTLTKHGFISSVKGPGGGFICTDATSSSTIMQVVVAVEGPLFCDQCLLGLPSCSDENPCPAHFKYKLVRQDIQQLFKTMTIGELATSLENNEDFLRI